MTGMCIILNLLLEGCYTVGGPSDGEKCVFPFTNNGKTYHICTYDDADDKKPWCSTKVYENGTHIQRIGAWGHCAAHRCQKVDAGKVIKI